MTVEQVIEVLNEYFKDTSRLVEDTKAGLLVIMEEIGLLLDGLQ